MAPRTAGIFGMVAGLGLSVLAGIMIAHPLVSILGALVLVAGTILFAVAATWTVRDSWDPSSWPEISVTGAKARRRVRNAAIFQCLAGFILVGGGVWQVATGAVGWINILMGAIFLTTSVTILRGFKKRADQN